MYISIYVIYVYINIYVSCSDIYIYMYVGLQVCMYMKQITKNKGNM